MIINFKLSIMIKTVEKNMEISNHVIILYKIGQKIEIQD